ncbi:hypothetical protein C5137_28585 [Bacillus cereus]|nr:L,D-transpeptidase [Bacillus cereus]MCI3150054.1 hypothetical protein [Bacillus cereus]
MKPRAIRMGYMKQIQSKVSEGCIRMQNADVEWLNAHVAKGTPIIIW